MLLYCNQIILLNFWHWIHSCTTYELPELLHKWLQRKNCNIIRQKWEHNCSNWYCLHIFYFFIGNFQLFQAWYIITHILFGALEVQQQYSSTALMLICILHCEHRMLHALAKQKHFFICYARQSRRRASRKCTRWSKTHSAHLSIVVIKRPININTSSCD